MSDDLRHPHYHKRYHHHHHHHHESDVYADSGCWVIFFLVILGVFVALIVVIAVNPNDDAVRKRWHNIRTPPHTVARTHNRRVLRQDGHQPRRAGECASVGESWDGSLCVPNFHSPVAFDGTLMDGRVPVCGGSFYRALCGAWIDAHQNQARSFTYLYHRNQQDVRQLLLEPNTAINDFYKSCLTLNTTNGQREGTLVVKHLVEIIVGDFKSHADLPAIFGRLHRYGFTAPFVFSIERHPLEPLEIPFFAYDNFHDALDEQHVTQFLLQNRYQLGYTSHEILKRVQAIMKLLRAFREHRTVHFPGSSSFHTYLNDTFLQRDLRPFAEAVPQAWNVRGHTLAANAWTTFFQALDGSALRFKPEQATWVIDHAYLEWLFVGGGIGTFQVTEWRAYIEFSILYNAFQVEPELPTDAYFRIHQGPLFRRTRRSLEPQNGTAESRCARITQHMIPGLIAKAYLERFLARKQQVRADVMEIAQNVRRELIGMIGESSEWLSADDRAVLIQKLERAIIRVAEPNYIWDPEPFATRIAPDRYDHNLMLVRQFRVARNVQRWHRDTPNAFDRDAISHFGIPTTEVNAYASLHTNTFTILGGILRAPLYDLTYNHVSKYALLGVILGHEMSHFIDHHGLYYDENGSYRPRGILSKQGMEAFHRRSACVAREFDTHECSSIAYGNATAAEDLADLTGVRAAYRAFVSSTGNKHPPLSEKQHFWMVLAQGFCETWDQAHRCEFIQHDEHAIAELRIDRTVRNMREFHEAFSCPLAPTAELCRVY